jgi:hypothetical protein
MTSSSRAGLSVYHPVIVAHDPHNTHPMVTRHAAGVTKPVDHLQLSTTAALLTLSPVPTSIRSTLVDPHWRHTMEEYEALLSNSAWDLVPRPHGANVFTGKWIFKYKLKVDGSLDQYKARWVLRGFTLCPRVDYDETFSPVIKPATIRVLLTLAVSRGWHVHQLDVNNALSMTHSSRPSTALSSLASLTPRTLSRCAGSTSPSTA